MTDMRGLEGLYALSMSEQERAELEAEIWNTLPKSMRPKALDGGQGKEFYISRRFSVSQHSVRMRHVIWSSGPDVAPILWERVNKDMPLSVARGILKEAARHAAAHIKPLSESVRLKLSEYDGPGGSVRTLKNGKKFVARGPAARGRGPLYLVADTSAPQSPRFPSDREFWMRIRSEVRDFVSDRLADADESARDAAVSESSALLNGLAQDVQRRVARALRPTLPRKGVSRSDLEQACLTLNMKPPEHGKPADLSVAFAQRGRHARVYHPDVHGGSEETLSKYRDVMEAYRTLEIYNETL